VSDDGSRVVAGICQTSGG